MSRIYDALKDAEHERSAGEPPPATKSAPSTAERSGLIGALKGKLFSGPQAGADGRGAAPGAKKPAGLKGLSASAVADGSEAAAAVAPENGAATAPEVENLPQPEPSSAERRRQAKGTAGGAPRGDAVAEQLGAASEQVAAIEADFARLAARLAEAEQDLSQKGTAPSEDLIAELSRCRRSFENAANEVLRLARSLGVPAERTTSPPATVGDLRTVFQVATFHAARQRAVAVLDRVLAIESCDGAAFPPLVESQDRARQLRVAVTAADWPAHHPDSPALASAQHPFAKLVALIEGGTELNDEQWLKLHDEVSDFFGKPLAVAVTRNRLRIPARASAPAVPAPERAAGVSSEKRASRCRNCDTELEAGAMFCGECGSPAA